MAHDRQHSIIVSSFDDALIERAHKYASGLFSTVSPVMDGEARGIRSFFVPSTGWPVGRGRAATDTDMRAVFVQWLDEQRHEDDSSSLAWIEVQYGDDEADSFVTSFNVDRFARFADGSVRRGYPQ